MNSPFTKLNSDKSTKKLIEKSRECHNHKTQPTPDSKRKGKRRRTKIDTCKTNNQMNKKNIHQGPGLQSIFKVRYLRTEI